MITCKEDLINTYIENDQGELRDLYLAKCEEFGLKTGADRFLQDGVFDHYDSECFEVLDDGKVYFPNFKNLSQNSRKLTMSDLKHLKSKPRTEIEYEQIGFHKCHEAMFKHEMEEKLYRKSSDGFVEADLTYIANNWSNGLYSQIEVEVDWRDEVESNLDFIDFDKGCNSIYLRTWPPIKEQQFLEMCRVTLRATGELE